MDGRKEVHIGDTIRHAVAFNVRNWRGGVMSTDTLLQSVAQLFALLSERQIAYALVGGIAMLNYVRGRNTEDIDLIMSLASLEKLPEIQIASQDEYFARGQLRDLKIDVLLTQNALFAEVQSKHTVLQHFLERNIPTATVEGLLLLKLYALPSLYRLGDFVKVGLYENDVAALIFHYRTPLEPILETLAPFVTADDLRGLRDILTDIQKRIRRFTK